LYRLPERNQALVMIAIEVFSHRLIWARPGKESFKHANANAAQYMPMFFAKDYHGRIILMRS